jgi:hypothetical protein
LSFDAAIFGTLAGLFGALMLFYGVLGIVWLIKEWRRWKFLDGEDVFEVGMLLLIGAVSAFVAFRWLRFAIKGGRATGGYQPQEWTGPPGRSL